MGRDAESVLAEIKQYLDGVDSTKISLIKKYLNTGSSHVENTTLSSYCFKQGMRGEGVFGFETLEDWVKEMAQVTSNSAQILVDTLSSTLLTDLTLFGDNTNCNLYLDILHPPFLEEQLELTKGIDYYCTQEYTNIAHLKLYYFQPNGVIEGANEGEEITVEIGKNVVALQGDIAEKAPKINLIINSDYITLFDLYWLFPKLKSVTFNGSTDLLKKCYYSNIFDSGTKLNEVLPIINVEGLSEERLRANGMYYHDIDRFRTLESTVVLNHRTRCDKNFTVSGTYSNIVVESENISTELEHINVDTLVYDIHKDILPIKPFYITNNTKAPKRACLDKCYINRLIISSPVNEALAIDCEIDNLIITDECTSITGAFKGCTFGNIEGLHNVKEFGDKAFMDCIRSQYKGGNRWDLEKTQKLTNTSFLGSEGLLSGKARMILGRVKKLKKD